MPLRRLASPLIAALALIAVPAVAHEPAKSLPRHDGKPADMTKPVQVFILLGQSNMVGLGKVKGGDNSLEHAVKEKKKYQYLVDDAGVWTERRDVRFVRYMSGKGPLNNEWMTVKGNTLGPEFGIGHQLGNAIEAPVMILKCCIGNRALGWDLLPPGSERFEFEGKVYAGYKDVAPSWDKGTEPKAVPWYAGRQYDADVAHAKVVLKNLEKYYPGYKGQGYRVAGFVWWQGHKDQNAAHAGRYEQNLVHVIKSLRKDFEAPQAKFVVATGCGNPGRESFGKEIAEAQLAVDGDQGKYPEFKGNVKAVDVRSFWREADVSPVNQGYHYNHNAETYYEVGNALGRAMADLLQKNP